MSLVTGKNYLIYTSMQHARARARTHTRTLRINICNADLRMSRDTRK